MLRIALLRRPVVVALGAVAFAVVPMVANPYYVYAANLALIYILLAIGLNIVLGFAGQLAFANGAMFGVGAYATGLLRLDAGMPFWLAMPAGAMIAALTGFLIALPALRLRGLYLALATIAFAQFAVWVFVHWDGLTHGTSGIVLKPVDFAPLTKSASTGLYYVSLAVTIGFVALAWNMLRSRIGRAFVAIRESEHAAAALTIDLTRYKTYAYVVSALYAGVAGSLFACVVGAVVPEQFNLFQIVIQFCMVFVGGVGTLWGAVIGAVSLVWLQEALRGLQEVQEFGFGILLLAVIMFFPGGIADFLRRRVEGWQEPLRRVAPDEPAAPQRRS